MPGSGRRSQQGVRESASFQQLQHQELPGISPGAEQRDDVRMGHVGEQRLLGVELGHRHRRAHSIRADHLDDHRARGRAGRGRGEGGGIGLRRGGGGRGGGRGGRVGVVRVRVESQGAVAAGSPILIPAVLLPHSGVDIAGTGLQNMH